MSLASRRPTRRAGGRRKLRSWCWQTINALYFWPRGRAFGSTGPRHEFESPLLSYFLFCCSVGGVSNCIPKVCRVCFSVTFFVFMVGRFTVVWQLYGFEYDSIMVYTPPPWCCCVRSGYTSTAVRTAVLLHYIVSGWIDRWLCRWGGERVGASVGAWLSAFAPLCGWRPC